MTIPQYAQRVPRHLLVQFLCKSSCHKVRYGQVSKHPWSSAGPNMDRELFVTCLMCGGIQYDNYNWMRL